MREHHGEAGVARFEEACSFGLRQALHTKTGLDAWCDFQLFIEANVLIDGLFGAGDLRLVSELGRYGARHNAGVWKALFERGVDPAKFAEIAPGLWHKHYDSGALIREVRGPRSVMLEISGFPTPHRVHCASVVGWLEGVFEFCDATRVSVHEESCRATGAPRCVMALNWP